MPSVKSLPFCKYFIPFYELFGLGHPVTPDFTDPAPDNQGVAVDRLNPKHCETVEKTVDNILVEEWDGYTWRKVSGNAPSAPVAFSSKRIIAKTRLSVQLIKNSTIRYSLSRSGNVCLQVMDIKGRVIATIVDGFREAGTHSVKWDDRIFGSNLYFIRLASGRSSLLKKFVYLH